MSFLPRPTRLNLIIITLYTAFIAGLLFILNQETGINDLSIQTLEETLSSISLIKQGIIGALLIWLFLSGIIVITIYAIFINHKLLLKQNQQSPLLFYFVFILWLAVFLSAELVIGLMALSIKPAISALSAGLISLAAVFIINTIGILLFYHYLKEEGRPFAPWLKKMVIGENKPKQLVIWGICGYIGIVPIFIIAALINNFVFQISGKTFPAQEIVEFSLKNNHPLVLLVLFVAVAVFAPFFEEIIMRGVVFYGLQKKIPIPVAIIFSGIIFAAFHFNVFALFPITVLGSLLAYLYLRTGALLPAMIAHALFNTVNFTLLEAIK